MTATAQRSSVGAITFRLVGFLFLVELTSGILQGYYVPLVTQIAASLHVTTADFNWTEAAQLLVSALVVPVLAKLGDMFGHKRILLISTAVTALATWGMVFNGGSFAIYLIAFALQGFYVVWLPLEVALIFDRGRRSGTAASSTRRAAGFLVIALEAGAIIGALGTSYVLDLVGGSVALTLIVPAACVTLVFFAILFGVPESERGAKRTLDVTGFVFLTLALLFIMGGLTFLRLDETIASWRVWVPILVGLALFVPFVRWELRHRDPAVDLRMLARPTMWPVQLTAGLIGISLLGAQIPLSAFAAAKPAETGYGMGLAPFGVSIVIGAYLVSMIVGALLFPLFSRIVSPRAALIVASFLVAIGYLLFLPLHDHLWQTIGNMTIAGIGSGALVGALPAAAAAASPAGRSGIATGLTNTTKTLGGALASAIFGVILHAGLSDDVASGAGIGSYLTVWTICGIGALTAAVLLFFVPRLAFADAEPFADAEIRPSESAAP